MSSLSRLVVIASLLLSARPALGWFDYDEYVNSVVPLSHEFAKRVAYDRELADFAQRIALLRSILAQARKDAVGFAEQTAVLGKDLSASDCASVGHPQAITTLSF